MNDQAPGNVSGNFSAKTTAKTSPKVSEEIKINAAAAAIRYALIATAVLVVAFLGYQAFDHFRASNSDKAFAALYVAEKLEAEAVPPTEDETGAGSTAKLDAAIAAWPQDKRDQYEKALLNVANSHSGTTAAHIAGLKLGRYYYGQGKLDDSEKAYAKVVSAAPSSGAESIYRALSLEAVGSIQESRNAFDKAFESYKQAADLKDNPLKPLSYLSAARALKGQGKQKEAEDYYQKVISEFPNSDYEKQARALMALKAAG